MSKKRSNNKTFFSLEDNKFNWQLCLYCQFITKENLVCPEILKRAFYNSSNTNQKTY